MDIENECAEALARVSTWIDNEAARHHLEIGVSSRVRQYNRDAWIGVSTVEFRAVDATHFVERGGADVIRHHDQLLYRSDPIYINVPAILAIWLRSTTPYRLARRIWVGESG